MARGLWPTPIHADRLFSRGGGQEIFGQGGDRGRNFRRPSAARGGPVLHKGAIFSGGGAFGPHFFPRGGLRPPKFFGGEGGSGVSPGGGNSPPCPPLRACMVTDQWPCQLSASRGRENTFKGGGDNNNPQGRKMSGDMTLAFNNEKGKRVLFKVKYSCCI